MWEPTSPNDMGMGGDFSSADLRSIALKGGTLIRQYRGMYPALMDIRESEIGKMTPELGPHSYLESPPPQ